MAALAVGAGLAVAGAAPAAAGVTGVTGGAQWSQSTAAPGDTVTLTGNYQSPATTGITVAVQLSVAGGGPGVITSFTASSGLLNCANDGVSVTCSWPVSVLGAQASIIATVNVPATANADDVWQGDASADAMGLGTDFLTIVAQTPTTAAATTTPTTAPGETTTTVAGATTTTAAAGAGGGATTPTTRPRPRSAALPATGSTSPQLVIAAMVTLLAGVGVVLAVRRRPT